MDLLATAGNPTFEYEFARVTKGSEALGATHGSEVVYVFGTLGQQPAGLGPPVVYTEIDEHISNQHFLSMEYIDGEDLASLMKHIGSLTNEKALDIARQLAAGLTVVHERIVLHRDRG